MKIPERFFNNDAQAGGFDSRAHVGVALEDYLQNNNVLIEGIRGTGKTHVLRMLESHCLSHFEQLRILPVYVSLSKLSEHARKDAEVFRLHLYTHIVERALASVEKHAEKIESRTGRKGFGSLLSAMFGAQRTSSISETISQLREIFEDLKFQLQFALTSQQVAEGDAKWSESEISGGAGVPFKFGVGVKGRGGSAAARDKTFTFIGRQLTSGDGSKFITDFFAELQAILRLEYTLVLLDECSEASPDAQIEVFRLFKAIRGADSKLEGKHSCFFIGTVYPQAKTNYPTWSQHGFTLQPGEDCSLKFLQRDETDIDSYISFFEDMITARSRIHLGLLNGFTEVQDVLFESREAFLLAALCAHGVPRRFWKYLHRAHASGKGKISIDQVTTAVQDEVHRVLLEARDLRHADKDLVNKLGHKLRDQNREYRRHNEGVPEALRKPLTVYFTVSQEAVRDLDNLTLFGLVHDKARMVSKQHMVRPQPVMAFDLAHAFSCDVFNRTEFISEAMANIQLSSNMNFQNSREFTPTIVGAFRDGGSFPDEVRSPEDATVVGKTSFGIVSRYEKGKYGFIAFGKGEYAYFHTMDLSRASEAPDGHSVVKFTLDRSGSSYVARNVAVVKSGFREAFKMNEGLVKSYNPRRFGFIDVFDGGEDALFIPQNVADECRETLSPGAHVVFFDQPCSNGRIAFEVREKPQ